MTYIYLDVLVVINIYVNYFLLKSTARITHTALSQRRCILASVIGTVTALTILLPQLSVLILGAIKLVGALFIIKIAFKKITIKRLFKLTAVFFTMSFIFAGVMILITQLTKVSSIIVNNYTVYFNISLLTLAVSTIIAYTAVCIVTYIFDKNCNLNHSYKVKVRLFGKDYIMDAVCDTGNSLMDSFTGKPIIICNSIDIANLADLRADKTYDSEEYLEHFKNFKGLRLLPYSTIGNQGIIPAFMADNIVIINEKNQAKPVDAYVGLCLNNSSYKAIFNPRLLI